MDTGEFGTIDLCWLIARGFPFEAAGFTKFEKRGSINRRGRAMCLPLGL